MNVLLTAYGHSLLIDSGGPYAYGNPERHGFVGALAHNVVVADDGSVDPGPVSDLVETDTATHSVVAGSYMVTKGVRDRRTVVLAKPELVLVVDQLQATDNELHRYRLLYHLPPDATVTADGTAGLVRAGTAGMGFRVSAAGRWRWTWSRASSNFAGMGHQWASSSHARAYAERRSDRPRAVVRHRLGAVGAGEARVPQVRVTESGEALEITVIRASARIGSASTPTGRCDSRTEHVLVHSA